MSSTSLTLLFLLRYVVLFVAKLFHNCTQVMELILAQCVKLDYTGGLIL